MEKGKAKLSVNKAVLRIWMREEWKQQKKKSGKKEKDERKAMQGMEEILQYL